VSVSVILTVVAMPLQAGRSCIENFTEKGDWSSGKTFSSFIDVKGTTPEKAYVAIGRWMSKDGLLGVSVSKDLGLVSAYQENNGKKSNYTMTVTEIDPGTLRIEWVLNLAQGLRPRRARFEMWLATCWSDRPSRREERHRIGRLDLPEERGDGQARQVCCGTVSAGWDEPVHQVLL
jgi:hypothetical protein